MHPVLYRHLRHYDPGKPGIEFPVVLSHGGARVHCRAMLDTGSSFCIFQREHGIELGLEIERGHRQAMRTATGAFITYGHEITLRSLGIEIHIVAYFAAEPRFPRNVLGRHGWLQQVRMGICDYEGKLYVSPFDE